MDCYVIFTIILGNVEKSKIKYRVSKDKLNATQKVLGTELGMLKTLNQQVWNVGEMCFLRG